MTLDTFLTLSDAAQKFGMAEASLRALVEKGKIRAGKLPTGEVIVSEQDTLIQRPVNKEDLPEYKKHAHLKGVEISISEASTSFRVPFSTLHGWVEKRYVALLKQEGRRVLVDKADVAYCAEIYHQRKGQGKWLFNSDGTPYQPKTVVLQS